MCLNPERYQEGYSRVWEPNSQRWPLITGIFCFPYVYDVHECSALAPETQWNARAELSRRLADHRPIEECARGTQAQAPHPSSGSGFVREHAEEHASALPGDYFSGYGSGLAHNDGKRVGDLHALSVNTACMQFGPNNCMVRLTPRLSYTPKVLPNPFRAQVITIQAFCSPEPNTDLLSQKHTLCPVRAYVDRTSQF